MKVISTARGKHVDPDTAYFGSQGRAVRISGETLLRLGVDVAQVRLQPATEGSSTIVLLARGSGLKPYCSRPGSRSYWLSALSILRALGKRPEDVARCSYPITVGKAAGETCLRIQL